jgi:hypothetical protein
MRYTTVVWDTSTDIDSVIGTKLAELTSQGIVSELTTSGDGNTVSGVRSWPTLEAAEAWVQFCLSVGASSASVNPE